MNHKVSSRSPRAIATSVAVLVIVIIILAADARIFGSVPKAAAATFSSNCTSPAVPTGTLPTAPSSFTLTVIGATGQTVTITQSTIFNYAACWSWGGFVNGGKSHDYGNYTGIPILTLVNLVGGVSSGGYVVTVGQGLYNCTYTYDEVTTGTGWSTESAPQEGSSCNGAAGNAESSITAGGTPVALASQVPLYPVLAYMENASDSATSGSPGVGAIAGTDGPLRSVTVAGGQSATSGILLGQGMTWNQGVYKIQVFNLGETITTSSTASTVTSPPSTSASTTTATTSTSTTSSPPTSTSSKLISTTTSATTSAPATSSTASSTTSFLTDTYTTTVLATSSQHLTQSSESVSSSIMTSSTTSSGNSLIIYGMAGVIVVLVFVVAGFLVLRRPKRAETG